MQLLDNEGRHVSFEVETDDLDEAIGRLAAAGIRSLTSAPPTLEELFLRHYGDDLQISQPAVAAEVGAS